MLKILKDQEYSFFFGNVELQISPGKQMHFQIPRLLDLLPSKVAGIFLCMRPANARRRYIERECETGTL